MLKRILLLSLAAMICIGCRSVTSHRSDSDQDEAAACALIYVLEKTTRLHEMSDECGALFFVGVSNGTLEIVSRHLDIKKPRLELGTKRLKMSGYVDRVTGKEAMLFELEIQKTSPNTYSARVVKSFGDLGGAEYFLDVTWLGDKWQITRFEVGYVA